MTTRTSIPGHRRHRWTRTAVGVPAVGLALVLAGCVTTPADAEPAAAPPAGDTVTAERVLQVTDVHAETGMTLLEGPVFDEDGRLYVVDVTAPPQQPKVLRIDLESEEVEAVYTDDTRALTSAQFSPHDGRLYVSDFLGSVVSMTPDGEDARVFFEDEVDGIPLAADDISFDDAGNLFVTDSQGAREPHWDASGRVVRLDRDGGGPTVLADALAAPNGIAFAPGGTNLWVSNNTGNTIDVLTLDETGRDVVTAHPGIRPDVGIAQVDSLATDADGNLYVGLHNRPAILVFDRFGEPLASVSAPEGDADVTSATNLAIRPGTTTAYVTMSGPGGGYIYSFEAFAEGTRASNGG